MDCDHVVTVIPTDTESYQTAFDAYNELLPRKKKKRKFGAPITKDKNPPVSVNPLSVNSWIKVLKIVYTEEGDEEAPPDTLLPPTPPTTGATPAAANAGDINASNEAGDEEDEDALIVDPASPNKTTRAPNVSPQLSVDRDRDPYCRFCNGGELVLWLINAPNQPKWLVKAKQ